MASAIYRTEKQLRVRNAAGSKIGVVREHYVRHDIPCQSGFCLECATRPGFKPTLPDDSSHYLIPDVEVAEACMDILEHPCINSVVWLQSVVNHVQRRCGRRHYSRLRSHVNEVRRQSAVFSNEHHAECWIPYSKQFPSQDIWQQSLIHQAARYLRLHLGSAVPMVILTLSRQFVESHANAQEGVYVVHVSDYIQNFWPGEEELVQLYSSLSASFLHSDLDGTGQSPMAGDRRASFVDYLPSQLLQAGLKAGRYLSGTLHVDKHFGHQRASVKITGHILESAQSVYIDGAVNRNRAIHGDRVVVEVLPRSQWTGQINSLAIDDDDSVGEKEVVVTSAKRSGRIVGVLEHNWREYVVYLPPQESDATNSRGKGRKVLVYPFDRRIPKVRISTKQAASLVGKRVVVRIDSWEKDSQYPNGHFVRSLGPAGSLETEISTILVENEINVAPFTSAMESDLPENSPSNPWIMDPLEIDRRRDLRQSHLIFSIDPKGCEDVDDALSVKQLSKGRLQLGVHIADVAHFVRAGSHLDAEAQSRGTTVYLADRRYDMLPSVLSSDLCSLHSNVDRYAVSVLWELDQNLDIVKVWFGRTVIRSKYKLEYGVAQAILDGASVADIQDCVRELQSCSEAGLQEHVSKLRWSLQALTRIATSRREIRDVSGALELEGLEVGIQLSADGHSVDDILPKEALGIHETVAECMIFANEHVARKICSSFPQKALLRRHAEPVHDHFDDLYTCASARGFGISTRSNSALAASLAKCEDLNDPNVNKIMRMTATQAMAEAQYVSTANQAPELCSHYGLALEKYTHFTSPIRRYADILVHRLLMASLAQELSSEVEGVQLQETAEHLNRKKRNADIAQKQSTALFQTLYFQSLAADSPMWITEVIICRIRDNAVMVYSPRYGIRAPLFLQDKDGLVVQRAEVGSDRPVFGPGTIVAEKVAIKVYGVTSSLEFHLFEHLKVRVELVPSDAHCAQLRFHLVSCAAPSASASVSHNKLGVMDLMKDVSANLFSDGLLSDGDLKTPAVSANELAWKQDHQAVSLYNILQDIKRLSIKCNSRLARCPQLADV